MKITLPLLVAGGTICLALAVASTWNSAAVRSGAPGLGVTLGAILLAAAGVTGLAGWAARNGRLPPPEQRAGMSLASFGLFTATFGAVFAAIVSVATIPDRYGYGRWEAEARHLEEIVRDLHVAIYVAALVLAAMTFLLAWIVGRAALAGPRDDEAALTGWGRTSAAIAPFVGSLALALFTLGAPALLAGVLAAESDLGDRAGHEGEAALFATGFLAVLALLLGIAALITRGKPGFLPAIFSPLAARLEARHAKGLLIATEVSGGLAAVALAVYFALT